MHVLSLQVFFPHRLPIVVTFNIFFFIISFLAFPFFIFLAHLLTVCFWLNKIPLIERHAFIYKYIYAFLTYCVVSE